MLRRVSNDAAEAWSVGFQDAGTTMMRGVVELYNNVMYYVTIMLVIVVWMMISGMRGKSWLEKGVKGEKKGDIWKDRSSLLEVIWTTTPALVLIGIALPSFKLLYLMDEVMDPSVTIKAVGWLGGLKSYWSNQTKDNDLKVKNNMDIFNPNIFTLGSYVGTWGSLQRRSFYVCNIRSTRRIGPHNEDIISVLTGSILGDAYMSRRSGEGVRVCYRQSIKNKDYLEWLYRFYFERGYSSELEPRMYKRMLKDKLGKEYYGLEFNTFTFSSLNWMYELFYKKGKKVVPKEICKYLKPLALAVWIMDDGGWAGSGVRIATNSFELKEIEILKEALEKKYQLKVTIQKSGEKNMYSLYIKKEALGKLRGLIEGYMHESMLYKLGIDQIKNQCDSREK